MLHPGSVIINWPDIKLHNAKRGIAVLSVSLPDCSLDAIKITEYVAGI